MRRSTLRRVAIYSTLLLACAGASIAQGPENLSSHEQAARELYQISGGAKASEAGAEAMIGALKSNPEMGPYEDVIRTWYRKFFTDATMESEMVKIYMGAFSEAELRELTAFYRSPIGQKALLKMPEVMQQSVQVGMRIGQEHSSDLQAMIAAAKKEREADKKPGS